MRAHGDVIAGTVDDEVIGPHPFAGPLQADAPTVLTAWLRVTKQHAARSAHAIHTHAQAVPKRRRIDHRVRRLRDAWSRAQYRARSPRVTPSSRWCFMATARAVIESRT
jgi:hypothetical protein